MKCLTVNGILKGFLGKKNNLNIHNREKKQCSCLLSTCGMYVLFNGYLSETGYCEWLQEISVFLRLLDENVSSFFNLCPTKLETVP